MSLALRLHHELLLLALHDDTGTIAFAQMLELGLAGAVLSEFLLEGRVELRPDGRKGRPLVTVASRATFGDPVLDDGLRLLASAKRRANPRDTVSRLRRIEDLRARTATALCRRGILRETEDRVLLLFKRRIYPTLDPAPERALVKRIREAIDGPGADVDPRTAVLISLARSTRTLRAIY
ncbi:MAG: GPP34 family phosphoprotein [Gemmatimonadota bacterium]